MKKKMEAFKIEFLKGLKGSDYQLVYNYDSIQTCIEIICISDLISRKSKFKLFKLTGTERILVQVNNRFLIHYMILQNSNRFDLYELTLMKYNEFEREASKRGLRE